MGSEANENRRFPDDGHGFTLSEKKVFWLAAEGMSRKEVAEYLKISNNTVGTHLKNAYRKLGVHNLSAAVAKLIEELLGPGATR